MPKNLEAHDKNKGKYLEVDYETVEREITPVDNLENTKQMLSTQAVPIHFLEPSERSALAILNKKSNLARKVIFENEFTKMSIQDIAVQWRIHMVAILREVLTRIDNETFSFHAMWEILNKTDRLLYVGITFVCLSVIMYVFNIVVA